MNNDEVITRFVNGVRGTSSSLATDGHMLVLFGNPIAWRPETGYGVCVTMCGWNSKTTRKYLNRLPGVGAWTEKGKPYINGIPVEDDEVLTIRTKGYKKPKCEPGRVWVTGTMWHKSDGWRGREEPVMAVCGANDTGMWSDSPCRSDVATDELRMAKARLEDSGVKYKERVGVTSNVFCVGRYIIVQPADMEQAKELVADLYDKTTLLYPCNT